MLVARACGRLQVLKEAVNPHVTRGGEGTATNAQRNLDVGPDFDIFVNGAKQGLLRCYGLANKGQMKEAEEEWETNVEKYREFLFHKSYRDAPQVIDIVDKLFLPLEKRILYPPTAKKPVFESKNVRVSVLDDARATAARNAKDNAARFHPDGRAHAYDASPEKQRPAGQQQGRPGQGTVTVVGPSTRSSSPVRSSASLNSHASSNVGPKRQPSPGPKPSYSGGSGASGAGATRAAPNNGNVNASRPGYGPTSSLAVSGAGARSPAPGSKSPAPVSNVKGRESPAKMTMATSTKGRESPSMAATNKGRESPSNKGRESPSMTKTKGRESPSMASTKAQPGPIPINVNKSNQQGSGLLAAIRQQQEGKRQPVPKK